jgi:LPS export ABC transporter protein LptC
MRLKKKTAILMGLAALAVMVAASIYVAEKQKTPEKLLKVLPDKVDLQIKDVHYTDVAESGMKWEVTADTARYIKKDNVALFEKVAVKLITRDGKTFLLTGDQGRVRTDTKDMKISGNVKIVSNSGEAFTTDYLAYSNGEQKFYTDAPITMENGRIKINGKGMTLSLKDEKLELLSDVKARIGRNP